MDLGSTLKHFAGLGAFFVLLLVATSAVSIGKSDKPRPPDEPMAMGEPPPQSEESKAAAKPTKTEADRGRPEAEARRSTPAEVIAAEERKHLKRVAQFNRIQAVGVETADQGLVDLARELRDKETRRHELSMDRLLRVFHLENRAGGGR